MKTNLLFENIKVNNIFYINVVICLFVISIITKYNFYITLISFIFISCFGYYIHVISHSINFNKIFKKKSNIKKNKLFYYLYKQFVGLIKIHTELHHDTNINKKYSNIILESLNNLMFQGVGLFIFVYFIKCLNINIFLLWAMLYTTIHLINYSFHSPEEHINHHKDCYTNYGIDLYDILFDTKNKNDSYVENYNHYSYNLIILTVLYLVIYYYTNKC